MSFKMARLVGQSVPVGIRAEVTVDEAEAEFTEGALGGLDVDGKFVEAGADPALGTVTHVAVTPYGVGGTYGPTFQGRLEFPPGKVMLIPVHACKFRAQYKVTGTNALPLPGGSYGVVKEGGIWKVDFDETTTVQVKHIGPYEWVMAPSASNPALASRPQYVEVEFLPFPAES